MPNVIVEFEGKTQVNVSTATDPYVKVWIDYIDGMQIELGRIPATELWVRSSSKLASDKVQVLSVDFRDSF